MDKKRVTVEMEDVLYESMQAAIKADTSGKSRSQFIRSAIKECLEKNGRKGRG